MPTTQTFCDWFDEGVARGARYMIVRCDTYDYMDYPSYHDTRDDAKKIIKDPGSMQRIMEVYDLHKPRDLQIAQYRCWEL